MRLDQVLQDILKRDKQLNKKYLACGLIKNSFPNNFKAYLHNIDTPKEAYLKF